MDRKSLVLNEYQTRKSCCYKCEDRTVGCHSVCEKYINELNERKAWMEKTKKDRELDLIDAERSINKHSYFSRVGCRK